HHAFADEALYGGAAGGGHTAARVGGAVTLALQHRGIPGDMCRRPIPERKRTILAEIDQQRGDCQDAVHKPCHGQGSYFKYSNGSTMNLKYCDTPADVYRYQGREMPILMCNELTQFPQDGYEYLKPRNRTSNGDWPVRIRAATNPGGVGH